LRAYEAGNETATDDSQLVEEVGGKVLIVEGRKDNLKITTPLDLRLAELILESRGANK
jgi:2-C-methyl-D-erythritol 4-phosphate cytidylyltransferase